MDDEKNKLSKSACQAFPKLPLEKKRLQRKFREMHRRNFHNLSREEIKVLIVLAKDGKIETKNKQLRSWIDSARDGNEYARRMIH